MLMSDPQQPGATGDQVPPIPPAPGAEAPSVPPAPAADAAPAAPQIPDAAAAPVPPVAPAAPAVDAAAPANPYAQAPANPYAAQQQAQNPYAAQPQAANPYAAQQPGYGAPAAPAYAAAPAGPSRFNVFGLISLIAGGVAFLFGVTVGWIPYVGFAFVLIALVGVGLGIAGLIVKNKAKGLAIAGTIVSGIALLLTAVISVFMLVVVSSIQQGLDDFGPDDPVITNPDGGETTTDDDPNALGSQGNPAAPGDTITFTDFDGVDEWQIVVGAPVLDATADVLAADEYNSAPEAGNQYVVVPATFTYVGNESDSPYMVLAELAGSDGVIYDVSYADYPDSLYDAPELTNGGSAQVNLVFEVPSSAVAGSALRLGSIWGNDIYIALD
jgi:hypothetical protein